MRWSRYFYCAATVALAELLITNGASPWITVPLGAFAAWWTYTCTSALWIVSSFHVAAWRLHQAPELPPLHDLDAPRTVKQWEWLSNPKLDRLVDAVTMVIVLGFPVLLWLPLILWLFGYANELRSKARYPEPFQSPLAKAQQFCALALRKHRKHWSLSNCWRSGVSA